MKSIYAIDPDRSYSQLMDGYKIKALVYFYEERFRALVKAGFYR